MDPRIRIRIRIHTKMSWIRNTGFQGSDLLPCCGRGNFCDLKGYSIETDCSIFFWINYSTLLNLSSLSDFGFQMPSQRPEGVGSSDSSVITLCLPHAPPFPPPPQLLYIWNVPERSFMHLTVSCWILISSGWGGGGGSSAVMLLNCTSAVMLLNRTGGVVWVLKPP